MDLSVPVVMGILNVTPDSFFDGGKHETEKNILLQAEKMINEGASIIDIGGMSSRPGAAIISVQEELNRVMPAIHLIAQKFPEIIISIDTIRAEVAKCAVDNGATIVNDISAGKLDDDMLNTVAALQVPYILMHMQGQPETMQAKPEYRDVVIDVLDFLIDRVGKCRNLGIKDIIIDPGFGFGKEIEHNFSLLKRLHAFGILECPILAGISRKSFIYKTLKTSAKDALTGTIALNMIALQEGAKILRVHDVKEALQTIKVWQALEDGEVF